MTPESGVSGVRIEEFISPSEIASLLEVTRKTVLKRIESASLTNELHTLGISLQTAYGNTDRYFSVAQQWRNDTEFMAAVGPDSPVIQKTIRAFQTAYQMPFEAATEKNRDLLPATLRCVDYAQVHKDVIASQIHWGIARLRNDLAWNIYLRMPEKGGELVLYPPAAESVVKECEVERFTPIHIATKPGDLVFFRSHIPHGVTRTSEPDVRLTVSGCAAFEPEPERKGRYWA